MKANVHLVISIIVITLTVVFIYISSNIKYDEKDVLQSDAARDFIGALSFAAFFLFFAGIYNFVQFLNKRKRK